MTRFLHQETLEAQVAKQPLQRLQITLEGKSGKVLRVLIADEISLGEDF